MLGFAWLALRQAQEALKNGRLEEAQRLLCQPCAQGHKRYFGLLQNVGLAFVERGERHLRHDNAAAAWNDLVAAEHIGVKDGAAARLRQALTRLGLSEARALLEAGEANRAVEVIGQLRHRQVTQEGLSSLEEAAKGWVQAKEQTGRGEFAQALEAFERVRRLLPSRFAALEQVIKATEERRQLFAALLVQLHEAADQKDWREVVRLSEQVLAMAPQHLEARKARACAWRVLSPETIAAGPQPVAVRTPPAAPQGPEQRYWLWIDGVGGYLVCLNERVTLGQATPDTYVDVPLFADVSRIHAAITRDSEGYLLEALRPLQVNGAPAEKALLQNGDRVTLGGSCQVQFRQPVPVSASARLDLVSGHRLASAVDGVLLMADTLVLGPGPQVHVAMPDVKQPIVMYRTKEGLGVRYGGHLVVDGQPCRERGLLRPQATVTGDDFAFAIEPAGTGSERT